jgi:hypothetical protein
LPINNRYRISTDGKGARRVPVRFARQRGGVQRACGGMEKTIAVTTSTSSSPPRDAPRCLRLRLQLPLFGRKHEWSPAARVLRVHAPVASVVNIIVDSVSGRVAANASRAARSSAVTVVFKAASSLGPLTACDQQTRARHRYAPRPAIFPPRSIFTPESGVRTTRTNSRLPRFWRQAIQVRSGTCFRRPTVPLVM